MTTIAEALPLLARHRGRWRGVYRHVTPDLTLIDRHAFEITVSFPGDGTVYRQDSRYTWDDGRTQDLTFEAQLRGETVVWDTGRIHGAMRAIDDDTLYLAFGFHADPALEMREMIHLAPNNRDRTRTWHWLRDHRLERLTLVDEARVDDD